MQKKFGASHGGLNRCRIGLIVICHDDVDLRKQFAGIVIAICDLAFAGQVRKTVRYDYQQPFCPTHFDTTSTPCVSLPNSGFRANTPRTPTTSTIAANTLSNYTPAQRQRRSESSMFVAR